MSDSVTDLVTSNPIQSLQEASKISVQGGGVFLFVAVLGVVLQNTDADWQISLWLTLTALVGAILLGLGGTVARLYDARLRVRLAEKLIDSQANGGTTKIPKDASDVLDGQIVMYLARPATLTTPDGSVREKDLG